MTIPSASSVVNFDDYNVLANDDPWYLDQENRTFTENAGHHVINEGEASGDIIGGNLCTLNLLQGTEYMPKLEDTILFIEDDSLSSIEEFDRNLQSLIHQPGFDKVRGILIGRFQVETKMTMELLEKIIKTKLKTDIPVIANVDFGHTTPQITFPIGGQVEIKSNKGKSKIIIVSH